MKQVNLEEAECNDQVTLFYSEVNYTFSITITVTVDIERSILYKKDIAQYSCYIINLNLKCSKIYGVIGEETHIPLEYQYHVKSTSMTTI